METLQAALWCLVKTDNYKACVLKAVNLGRNTDTTAAVAGGLAGILYGYDGIPAEWMEKLQRKDDHVDFTSTYILSIIQTNVRV